MDGMVPRVEECQQLGAKGNTRKDMSPRRIYSSEENTDCMVTFYLVWMSLINDSATLDLANMTVN